jgi:hypothetical protein
VVIVGPRGFRFFVGSDDAGVGRVQGVVEGRAVKRSGAEKHCDPEGRSVGCLPGRAVARLRMNLEVRFPWTGLIRVVEQSVSRAAGGSAGAFGLAFLRQLQHAGTP